MSVQSMDDNNKIKKLKLSSVVPKACQGLCRLNPHKTDSDPLFNTVRDLGFFLIKILTNHTRSNARSCFFHLHCVGKLHQYLNRKTANAIAVSLVLSRLDYFNSCLWGMPKNQQLRLW